MECPFCGAELMNGSCLFIAEQWHEAANDDGLLLSDMDVSDIT
jgi:hypothetical protein